MRKTNIHISLSNLMVAAVLAAIFCISCEKDKKHDDTIIYDGDRRVMLLYADGHNSLSSYLKGNIEDLLYYSDFSSDNELADAILIFTNSGSTSSYTTPYLLYPHKEKYSDVVVIDTLVTYPSGTISSSPQVLNEVLTYVKDNFPADKYGLVYSSHGTGYLPAGYYNNSSSYENRYANGTLTIGLQKSSGKFTKPESVPGRTELPGPPVKSIGSETNPDGTYEIDLNDFAQAIPMRLDYIIFDACFMGGVEVAYELRDKVNWLMVSPAEILAQGMNYMTMQSYLFQRPEADYKGFCQSYYDYYNALSGSNKSATISLVDCSMMDSLAGICAELFDKYRDALDNMDYNDVQPYFRYSLHWFYDLGDIVEHLGCTAEELAEFEEIMSLCLPYKAATDEFIRSEGGFYITKYSGLSMMLPCNAGNYLKDWYKAYLGWNSATNMVE